MEIIIGTEVDEVLQMLRKENPLLDSNFLLYIEDDLYMPLSCLNIIFVYFSMGQISQKI